VQKISTDIDGDPNLLLAGERLRYTITVRNVGTEDVSDASLRDAIPVEHDLRRRQHEAERRRDRGRGRRDCTTRERHPTLDAVEPDAGLHAGRHSADADERRDDRVRRAREPRRDRRHGDLEPGVRVVARRRRRRRALR
jgi:uncharacterized repeat protein (TIGR01451 family)